MRIAFGAVLLLHGIAHIVGFLRAWAPTRTTIVGNRIDLGASRIRVVGLGWLLIAVAFGVAAVASLVGITGWPTFALVLTGVSLALCLLQLPETKIGVVLNVVLIAGLFYGQRAGWI
ncbi:MAG: hypothetical protein H0V17_29885 [Deltaproteobacteria bacterium]|nr:hypothetical protein [Deltaproteobacteria bacterium]